MSELTEKRRSQTRSDIADAAIALFQRYGFAETSMGQIGEAAGVSRRTVYRHFPTKDDLVFEHPRRWFETMEAILAARAEGESTRDLYRRGLVAVAETIQADAAAVLDAYSVLVATPSLRVRHSSSDQLWMNRCIELLAADLGDQPDGMFRAGIAAGALIGATNATIALWAAGQPAADIVSMIDAALDQIDSIWPQACRT